MRASDFYEKIYDASELKSSGKVVRGRIPYLINFAACALASDIFTISYFGNPFYHISGFLSWAVSRIADVYSTIKIAKLLEDPHFKEYNLYETYVNIESNPLLKKLSSKVFPNKITVATEAIACVVSIGLPPIGHGLALTTPLISENDWAVYNRLRKSIEIGDNVKKMIEAGSTEDDVNKYLESLT